MLNKGEEIEEEKRKKKLQRENLFLPGKKKKSVQNPISRADPQGRYPQKNGVLRRFQWTRREFRVAEEDCICGRVLWTECLCLLPNLYVDVPQCACIWSWAL